MLIVALFEQSPGNAHVSQAGLEIGSVLSNHSAAPYAAAAYCRSHNRLADTFEWTNGSLFLSSYDSLRSGRGTN